MIDNQRKIAEIWGFTAFKMLLRFVLITAAFSLDRNFAAATIIILLAIDLALQANITATEAFAIDIQDKAWMDTLTNRIFYKKLFEKIRDGERPDVDELFNLSTTAAVADIKQAREDAGFLSKLGGFSKFGYGLWSFISNVVGYVAGYGIPYFVASLLHP